MLNQEIENLRKKAEELTSLIEISKIVNSVLDLKEVIRLVMEKAQEVMAAEASSVFLHNSKTNRLEIQSALGQDGEAIIDTTENLKEKVSLKMGQGIAGWVALKRQHLNVADVRNDSRFFSKADKATGFQTRSILAAPLQVRDKLIGVAEVINRKDNKPFDDENIRLFSTFCDIVAMAIENARLHKEMIEKERFQQQLKSARIIQQSFLPQSYPVCPTHRFEVAASYLPARTIGGDFYDFLNLDEDHLGIAFGDVSGKGIPAALYMARLLSDFHLQVNLCNSFEQAINKLNNTLVERNQQGMFVTFVGAILNAETGEFLFVNAGHLPLLKVNLKTKKVEKIAEASGIPLGIKKNIDYKQSKIQLDHGDFVIFFTDGLIEARNVENDEISLEKLMKILNNNWKSPEQLIQKVNLKIQNFTKSVTQHDDITLVALKWC